MYFLHGKSLETKPLRAHVIKTSNKIDNKNKLKFTIMEINLQTNKNFPNPPPPTCDSIII